MLALGALLLAGCKRPAPAPAPNFQAEVSLLTPEDGPEPDGDRVVSELANRAATLRLSAAIDRPERGTLEISFFAEDETQARARLEALIQSGRLSIRAVHDQNAFLLADRTQIPADHEVLTYSYRFDDGTERTEELVVNSAEIVSSAHIQRAAANHSADGVINLTLTRDGGRAMASATKTMKKGRSRLAIIYDDRIISAPVVNDILSAQFIIQGFHSFEETKAVAAALSQPLSAKLQIESLKPLAPEPSKP